MSGLRPYQEAALEAVRRREYDRGIIAIPTGCGKGHISGHLLEALGVRRALYLAHRQELIEQLVSHIERVTGQRPGVERAEHRSAPMDDVVVASVATLAAAGGRRLEKWHPERFEAVIVDEAHHATAESYLRVWRHFGILGPQNEKPERPRLPLIGLTATPGRGDNVGLSNVFDGILFHYKLVEAIKDGWLAPIHAFTCRTETSLDEVKTRGGEFVESELAKVVNNEERNSTIVDAWERFARGLPTVVFCVDIAHAKAVAGAFAARGVSAAFVHGGLEGDERRRRIEALAKGDIQVLANCALLTEGTDIPEIQCVLMARPTRSPTLYAQCIGRGTRLARGAYDIGESVRLGKERCVVIDITDSTEKAGRRAVNIGDLIGLPLPEKSLAGEDVVAELERQEKERLGATVKKASRTGAFDLFGDDLAPPDYCRLSWVRLGDELYLALPSVRLRLVQNMLDQWVLEGRTEETPWTPVPPPSADLRDLVVRTERWVQERYPDEVGIVWRTARWREEAPTEKQLKLCRRLGIAVPPEATKGQVSAALDAHFAAKRGAA